MTYRAIEEARKMAECELTELTKLTMLKEVLRLRKKEKKMRVGDTCILKSSHNSGPVLTVTRVTTGEFSELAAVCWFDRLGSGYEFKTVTLPVDCLDIWPPKEEIK